MTSPASSEALSAQVILRENPPKMSESADVQALQDFFSRAGFTTGPMIGNNFSITATRQVFQQFFGQSAPLPDAKTNRIPDKEQQLPLPTHSVPVPLAEKILAVTFTPPPAFGPAGSW